MVLGLFHDGPAALPADTVLGAYLGAYARDDTSAAPADAADAPHPTRREERRQLAYDFDLLAPGGGLGLHVDGLHVDGLYVDGTRFVNAMAYLNSYDNQAPRANVKFVGARVNGWPATLVLTAATVPPGAEFLADYGKGYYQEFYAGGAGEGASGGAGEGGGVQAPGAAGAGLLPRGHAARHGAGWAAGGEEGVDVAHPDRLDTLGLFRPQA